MAYAVLASADRAHQVYIRNKQVLVTGPARRALNPTKDRFARILYDEERQKAALEFLPTASGPAYKVVYAAGSVAIWAQPLFEKLNWDPAAVDIRLPATWDEERRILEFDLPDLETVTRETELIRASRKGGRKKKRGNV